METKFNFNSQVCTSRSQSERLLALGLKKEIADMCSVIDLVSDNGKTIEKVDTIFAFTQDDWEDFGRHVTPRWSLHRLIEMMPEEMYGGLLCIFKDSIRYEEVIMDRLEAHFDVVGDNMYENAISCIEWLIKEGHFNKEYLV